MSEKSKQSKWKPDWFTGLLLLIPVIIGLVLILGNLDINGDQTVFKKVPLEVFESWDCDLQLKYQFSTLAPETHRQSYIKNCMENNP